MDKGTDKDYEALLEDYQDALMRLIMYRVGQENGKRLLEEKEKLENSGFEVPKELDEKCIDLIQSTCDSKDRKQVPVSEGAYGNESPHRFHLHTVGRALVAAILAAVMLFCVAYAANDQFRVNVLNFFLELRENGTQFFFGSGASGERQPNLSGTSAGDADFPFEFTYIPEGFELIVQESHDLKAFGMHFHSRYARPDDEYSNFLFDICPINSGTGMLVDTENADVTNATIHGYDGWIIKKVDVPSGRECTMYLWLDLENGYSFEYCAIGISDVEIQKIFDNLMINEQLLKTS